MSIYLNEYDPGSNAPSKSVTAEANKIRFNNIQSCVGVVVHHLAQNQMVGVHLTTWTTFNKAHMKGVVEKIKAITGKAKNKIYLVYGASHQVNSYLLSSLKPIATQLLGCVIQTGVGEGADLDVNVKLEQGEIAIWVRKHANFIKNDIGGAVTKPKYVGDNVLRNAAIQRGKSPYVTDKEDKPWVKVPISPI